jgi:hypothetical protein
MFYLTAVTGKVENGPFKIIEGLHYIELRTKNGDFP